MKYVGDDKYTEENLWLSAMHRNMFNQRLLEGLTNDEGDKQGSVASQTCYPSRWSSASGCNVGCNTLLLSPIAKTDNCEIEVSLQRT